MAGFASPLVGALALILLLGVFMAGTPDTARDAEGPPRGILALGALALVIVVALILTR